MKRLLFAMIVALLPLEGVARLWVAFDPTSDLRGEEMTWDADPGILYRPKPGARVGENKGPVNSIGMRGPEADPTAPDRLLMIGDSVLYGLNLPESDGMAARVRKEIGTRWSVMNAGVVGYSTWQERRYLERLDPIVNPTAVAVVYCTNDAWKFSQELSWSEYYRRGEPVLDAVRLSPVGLVSAARYLGAIRAAGEIKRDVEAHPPAIQWPGEWSAAWSDLAMRAARGGRPAVALLVPSELQLDRGDVATNSEARDLAEAAGVQVVDLLDAFRAEPRGTLYLPNDPIHLSPRGHAIAARAIVAAL